MEEQNETTDPKTPRPRCKNCNTKLSKQGNFCPGCGQRDFDGRVRMRDLLAKFFANFTHLDNKFVKMCWQLLVPARVTLNYFQGKIKRYPHPVQFFFIVMFFFLLMFSKKLGNAGFNPTGGNFSVDLNGEEEQASKSEKLLAEVGLFATIQHSVAAKELRAAYDTLPLALQVPVVRQALDSVARLVEGPYEDALHDFAKTIQAADSTQDNRLDSLTLNFAFSSVRISTTDLVSLSPDSIIRKYGFTDWDQKVTVRQGIKSLKDPESLIRQYVGSLGWSILALIALMAFVLRLQYWKRGGYYVEHFIFLMHQQSGAFLLLTLALVVQDYLFRLGFVWLLVMAWIGVSLLLAMKRFYKEKWGWTIAKWLVYCGVYVVGLVMLFIATLLVVFVVF